MIRKIIRIDEEKCNGCGLCAKACHEGAIGMADGKAKLLREDYCDGLGDCLPACPANAISFEEREAPAYNEAAVLAAKAAKEQEDRTKPGCLRNFPVQLQLAPVNARWFDGAEFPMYFDGTNRYSGTVDSEGVYYVSVTTADGKQARHILRFEDNRVCCLELDLSK